MSQLSKDFEKISLENNENKENNQNKENIQNNLLLPKKIPQKDNFMALDKPLDLSFPNKIKKQKTDL